jgi:hypothetical protein
VGSGTGGVLLKRARRQPCASVRGQASAARFVHTSNASLQASTMCFSRAHDLPNMRTVPCSTSGCTMLRRAQSCLSPLRTWLQRSGNSAHRSVLEFAEAGRCFGKPPCQHFVRSITSFAAAQIREGATVLKSGDYDADQIQVDLCLQLEINHWFFS